MSSELSTLINKFSEIFSAIPFNKILGVKLDLVEEDHIVLSFTTKQELIGNFLHGILHGGVISSVLDMAGGTAAMLAAIRKKLPKSIEELAAVLGKASTINLHVDYLRPGRGEHFFAKAWILHAGNKIVFSRLEMHNDDGTLIAAGNATYMIG